MEEKNRQIVTLIIVFMIGMAGTAAILGLDSDDSDDGKEQVTQEKENSLPVASMYASNTEPTIGDEVAFDASSSQDADGNIENYIFDFGDGIYKLNTTEAVVTHVFEDIDSFDVTLVVMDSNKTISTNTMTITITVQPLEELDDVNPSHRSIKDEEDAEEFLNGDPLSDVPEIPFNEEEQTKEEYNTEHITQALKEPSGDEFEDVLGTEETPSPEWPDPDFQLDLDETDLENMAKYKKGIGFAEKSTTLEDQFVNSVGAGEVTEENFDDIGYGIKPVKNVKNDYRKVKNASAKPTPAKHTSYKASYVVDSNTFDNDTDGNNEFAGFKAISYEMVGHRRQPVYESFAVFHMVAWDNDSDGNPEFVKITGFSYESYDKNGDGNVEFANVHIVRVVVVDGDDNGQPNFARFFEGEFMTVDANSNGSAEVTKGDFKSIVIHNNGTTEQPNFLKSSKWGFVAVDRKNRTPENNEYALVYGEKFVFWDNDTSEEQVNFARYEFFTYIRIDLNDDGVPGLEKAAYEKWVVVNIDGDANPNRILYDKVYTARDGNKGTGFIHGEKVRIFDNDTNGHFDYAGFEKFSYLYRDRNNDGNKEFEGLHYEGIKTWDNKTGENESDPVGDGEVDYLVAAVITYTGRDTNDDGEKEKQRFILKFYVLDNDDSDGTSGEFYVKYDSDDKKS